MDAINWNHVIFVEHEFRLILSELHLHEIPDAIINLYHNRVRQLDVSFNKLTSISGITLFTNLEELILDNNRLADPSFSPNLNLKILSLNNNKIKDLEKLLNDIHRCFPNLRFLSLLGNPCCPDQLSNLSHNESEYRHYRLSILSHSPKLRFLDSTPISLEERRIQQKLDQIQSNLMSSTESNPKFSQISKILFKAFTIGSQSSDDEYGNGSSGSNQRNIYSPLPTTIRVAGEHKGAYGKSNYKYVGAHSEGNRFILNKDL